MKSTIPCGKAFFMRVECSSPLPPSAAQRLPLPPSADQRHLVLRISRLVPPSENNTLFRRYFRYFAKTGSNRGLLGRYFSGRAVKSRFFRGPEGNRYINVRYLENKGKVRLNSGVNYLYFQDSGIDGVTEGRKMPQNAMNGHERPRLSYPKPPRLSLQPKRPDL